jgi:hypothetical protein
MIAVLVLVGYVAVGIGLAWWDMPRLWARAQDEWAAMAHDSVRLCTILTVLFWPVRLPLVGLWTLAGYAADRGDPKRVEEELAEAQRRNAELQRRIAELERQEGIGQ